MAPHIYPYGRPPATVVDPELEREVPEERSSCDSDSASSSASDSEDSLEAPMQQDVYQILIDSVAKMEATRPEIIRAVPVHLVLRGLARAFRAVKGDFYKFSKPATRTWDAP